MNNTNNSSKSKVASIQCERSNTAWLPRYGNTYYKNI